MKIQTTLLLLFVFLLNVNAKDKKTIIERINESESVPVYAVIGQIKSEAYNATTGKIGLNGAESMQKSVLAPMPSGTDTLLNVLVSELNLKFSTTKFVAGTAGTEDEIKTILKSKNESFFVLGTFDAKYNYLYTTPVRRDNGKLVAQRKLAGSATINFARFDNEFNVIREFGGTGGFVYSKPFYQTGYTHNANVLAKRQNPSVLLKYYPNMISSRLEKFYLKQVKKFEKATKKKG